VADVVSVHRELVPGESYATPYPFVRELYDDGDPDGGPRDTWRPGTRFEETSPEGAADCIADAIGQMELMVVSLHKPGEFPARVFYLREWIAPNGSRFGKRKLRMTTVSNFRALLRGYRHRIDRVTNSEGR
jgi:hypothetical protein